MSVTWVVVVRVVTQPPFDYWERLWDAVEKSGSFKTWFREGFYNIYILQVKKLEQVFALSIWKSMSQFLSLRWLSVSLWNLGYEAKTCAKFFLKHINNEGKMNPGTKNIHTLWCRHKTYKKMYMYRSIDISHSTIYITIFEVSALVYL